MENVLSSCLCPFLPGYLISEALFQLLSMKGFPCYVPKNSLYDCDMGATAVAAGVGSDLYRPWLSESIGKFWRPGACPVHQFGGAVFFHAAGMVVDGRCGLRRASWRRTAVAWLAYASRRFPDCLCYG